MNFSIELNSAQSERDYDTSKIRGGSVVSEVFSAMVGGQELSRFGKKADKAVEYIKSLGERAMRGDGMAAFELNALRKFQIEPLLLEEIKLLSLFGSYQAIGFDETPEAEVYRHEGVNAKYQANNGDVGFPIIVKDKYPVASRTVSGGNALDYRRVQLGDMSKENEGQEQVRIDIRNKAALYVMMTVYNSTKQATGVKYFAESAGITKAVLDSVVKKVRRWGRPSIIGDYSVVSQINDYIPYSGGVVPITGISDVALEELRKNGIIDIYNGSVVAEIPNPYDVTRMNSDGSNFATLAPEGLLFIIPQGARSPVQTWTRGGLTTFQGTDVASGRLMVRFDLEVAADLAKGHEFEIGLIGDTNFEVPEI